MYGLTGGPKLMTSNMEDKIGTKNHQNVADVWSRVVRLLFMQRLPPFFLFFFPSRLEVAAQQQSLLAEAHAAGALADADSSSTGKAVMTSPFSAACPFRCSSPPKTRAASAADARWDAWR